MFWTKTAHHCTIFRLLCAPIKVYPIPHTTFETTRSGFLQILHHYSVSWKITLYFFKLKPYMLWTKIAHWNQIFGLLSGWVKILQIPHVIFKTTSQFFFKLCIFNIMPDKSSVLFYLKLYMIFTKGAHHSAKFQTFDCSGEISPNLYFDRLLCWKYIKF